MATTAEKIKLLQKRYKLTSRKMAEIVGKSLPSWNNYISGKTTVTREILMSLSEYFDVPYDELIGDEGLKISKRGRKAKRDLLEQDMEGTKEVASQNEDSQKTGSQEMAPEGNVAQEEKSMRAPSNNRVQVYFQSNLGQTISYEELLKRAPEDAISIYVKPEEGKAYWTGMDGESGAVELW